MIQSFSTEPQLLLVLSQLKNEIADKIKSSLSGLMEGYGYRIIDALVTDVRPDHKVTFP